MRDFANFKQPPNSGNQALTMKTNRFTCYRDHTA